MTDDDNDDDCLSSSTTIECQCDQHRCLQRFHSTHASSSSTTQNYPNHVDNVNTATTFTGGTLRSNRCTAVIFVLIRTIISHLFDVILFVLSSSSSSTTTTTFRPSSDEFYIRLLLIVLLPTVIDACSTRPSPKPRPLRPDWNPDRNLPRLNCTEDYRDLYCLNNGTCYMQLDISNQPRPYCACSPGYRGRRCELIHDDNIYLPSMQAQKLETAALSALVTLIIIATCIASLALYLYRRRVRYPVVDYLDTASDIGTATIDHPFSDWRTREQARAFRVRPMSPSTLDRPSSSRSPSPPPAASKNYPLPSSSSSSTV